MSAPHRTAAAVMPLDSRLSGVRADEERRPPLDDEGVFTVLITDLERSTELWERFEPDMPRAISAHNDIVAAAVHAHGGWVLQFRGDGVLALFRDAAQAVLSAVDVQREFSTRTFEGVGELRVRIGLNTGWCAMRSGELSGRPPNLAARLEAAGHGGQILVSGTTADACAQALPADVDLFELGRYYIRGFDHPVILHSVVASDLRSVFPPLRTSLRGLDELPADDSTLIGREHLIERVNRLVRDHPVVTLWGPAGVGKTRLGVRVAGTVRRPFTQGVRFVDLSMIESPDRVVGLVVSALRAQPTADERPIDTVLRVLAWARLLLVLDNCEHVLDEVRSMVQSITNACPGTHVLATSREVIGVDLEQSVEVHPLETPADQMTSWPELERYPSVRLFVERARAVDPSFGIDSTNGPAVASVCRAAAGLPLALELAASRMDVETVEQIGAHDGTFISRLTRSPASAHQLESLKSSLEWSYRRLPQPTAALLRRAATFAGAFTVEMVASISENDSTFTVNDDLAALVRSSMITRDAFDRERFRMLETSREFARDVSTSEEWDGALRSHALLMLERAERWGPLLKTSAANSAVDALRAELADHRRAFAWFADTGAVEQAARLVVSLFEFGLFNLHAEVHDWANWVAERVEDVEPLASEVFGAAALGAWFTGDTERAISFGQRALRAAEHHSSTTYWARTALVNAYGYSGQTDGLVLNFQAMVNEQTRSPEPFWQVNGLVFETISLSMFGRYDRAEIRAENALAISRRMGNPYCTYWALYGLGRARTVLDPPAAIEAFGGALRAAREVDSRFNVGLALVEWLALSRRSGEIGDCVASAVDLLDMLALSGNRSQMSETLREVGHLLARTRDDETAALAVLGRRGLPQMPGGSADPHSDEVLQAELKQRLGREWTRLETLALAMPERQLLATCREALLR